MSARILLADDEADLLEPLSYALSQHGFEVATVANGDAALEQARSGAYDLLICDVLMPGMLGTDVCRVVGDVSQRLEILAVEPEHVVHVHHAARAGDQMRLAATGDRDCVTTLEGGH